DVVSKDAPLLKETRFLSQQGVSALKCFGLAFPHRVCRRLFMGSQRPAGNRKDVRLQKDEHPDAKSIGDLFGVEQVSLLHVGGLLRQLPYLLVPSGMWRVVLPLRDRHSISGPADPARRLARLPGASNLSEWVGPASGSLRR